MLCERNRRESARVHASDTGERQDIVDTQGLLAQGAKLVGTASAGYLLGTTPSAVVAARVAGGADPRRSGTGNPGAANVAATSGATVGLVVLVADVAKAVAAARLGGRWLGPDGRHLGAVASVIGHCHPVWSGFRGGKGVATSVGQVLTTFPIYAPVDAAVALGTAAAPKLAADAERITTISSAAWVGSTLLAWRRGWSNPGAPVPTVWLPVAAAVSSAVILGRFRAERRGPGGVSPEHDESGAGS